MQLRNEICNTKNADRVCRSAARTIEPTAPSIRHQEATLRGKPKSPQVGSSWRTAWVSLSTRVNGTIALSMTTQRRLLLRGVLKQAAISRPIGGNTGSMYPGSFEFEMVKNSRGNNAHVVRKIRVGNFSAGICRIRKSPSKGG